MTTLETEPAPAPVAEPITRPRMRRLLGVACAVAALGVSISPVIGAAPGGDEAHWMGMATFLDFFRLTDVVIERQVGLGRWLPLEALLVGGTFSTFTSTWAYKLVMYGASISALVYSAHVATRYVRQRWALPLVILAFVPVVQLRTYHDGVGQYFAVMPALLALLAGIVHMVLITEERGLTRGRVVGLVVLATAAALLSNLTIFVLPVLLLVSWFSNHARRQRIVAAAAIATPILMSGALTYVLRRRAATPYPVDAQPWDIAASALRETWSVVPFSYVRSEGWSERADFGAPSTWWIVVFAVCAFVALATALAERNPEGACPPRRALVLNVAGLGLVFLPALGVSLSGQHQHGTLGVGYIEVTVGYGGVAWFVAGLVALATGFVHTRRPARPPVRPLRRAAVVIVLALLFTPIMFATFKNNAVAIDNFWAHEGSRELADSHVAELVFENQPEPDLTVGLPFLTELMRGYFPERWDDERTRSFAGVSDGDLTAKPTSIITGTAEPRVVFALIVPDETKAPASPGRPACTILWWADDLDRIAAVQIVDGAGVTYDVEELATDGRSHLAVSPPAVEGCGQLQFAPR